MKTTEYLDNPDRPGEVIVKQTVHGITELLDHNHELRQTKQFGVSDMKLVANIPGELIQKYCEVTGITWADFHADHVHIKRILNDPANAYFRVAPGKV